MLVFGSARVDGERRWCVERERRTGGGAAGAVVGIAVEAVDEGVGGKPRKREEENKNKRKTKRKTDKRMHNKEWDDLISR
ncbi:hypothetical protein CBR_g31984 [Chara braunii]|uniref:Uncharacterized protein n=1 Tax=Chara braunii TaxID=69332 RepID=A0A388LG82_CHABU|nr:hypothetical protein CBR_g31984 [Chara braunii]|eukprot:GBG81309.1 hypothetical protein CBR_g31984 [Chara braunii]